MAKDPRDALERYREAIDVLGDYVVDNGYDLKFAIEPKPNEPRGDIFLPTVGHALHFVETLKRPEMVGVNPEVAHETMAGLSFHHAVGQALWADKLFHIDLNAQRIGRYDQDFRFGAEDLKEAFLLVRLLERAGYSGPLAFDAHSYRNENADGVWDFARGCMTTYTHPGRAGGALRRAARGPGGDAGRLDGRARARLRRRRRGRRHSRTRPGLSTRSLSAATSTSASTSCWSTCSWACADRAPPHPESPEGLTRNVEASVGRRRGRRPHARSRGLWSDDSSSAQRGQEHRDAGGQGECRRDPARHRNRRPAGRTRTAPFLGKAFQAAGVKSDIQNANGDKAKFATIADQMLNEGVNVLLIVNLDCPSARRGHQQGPPAGRPGHRLRPPDARRRRRLLRLVRQRGGRDGAGRGPGEVHAGQRRQERPGGAAQRLADRQQRHAVQAGL